MTEFRGHMGKKQGGAFCCFVPGPSQWLKFLKPSAVPPGGESVPPPGRI